MLFNLTNLFGPQAIQQLTNNIIKNMSKTIGLRQKKKKTSKTSENFSFLRSAEFLQIVPKITNRWRVREKTDLAAVSEIILYFVLFLLYYYSFHFFLYL